MEKIKNCVEEMKGLINKNGWEVYRKAMLFFEFGVENEIEENMNKINRVYDEYMDNDYFNNIVDEHFCDIFNEIFNDEDEEDLFD